MFFPVLLITTSLTTSASPLVFFSLLDFFFSSPVLTCTSQFGTVRPTMRVLCVTSHRQSALNRVLHLLEMLQWIPIPPRSFHGPKKPYIWTAPPLTSFSLPLFCLLTLMPAHGPPAAPCTCQVQSQLRDFAVAALLLGTLFLVLPDSLISFWCLLKCGISTVKSSLTTAVHSMPHLYSFFSPLFSPLVGILSLLYTDEFLASSVLAISYIKYFRNDFIIPFSFMGLQVV